MPSSWMRTSMNQRVELIKWNEPMAVDFFHLQSYWGWEREGGQHNNNNDNNDQWHEYNRKLIDNRLITMRFHTDMQMRCKWERQPTAIGWRTRNVFEWLVQWFFWKNWEREGGGGGSWWKWSFNSFLWAFVFVFFFRLCWLWNCRGEGGATSIPICKWDANWSWALVIDTLACDRFS